MTDKPVRISMNITIGDDEVLDISVKAANFSTIIPMLEKIAKEYQPKPPTKPQPTYRGVDTSLFGQ